MKVTNRLKLILFTAISSALISLVLLLGSHTPLIKDMENWGFDLLVRIRGYLPPFDKIHIVDFDDATIAAIKTYPVPRRLLANVLDKIVTGKPDLIGLDIILSERRDPVEDRELASALANAENVVLIDNFGSDRLARSEPLPEFRQHALDVGFANLPVDSDGFIRRMLLGMRTRDYAGLSFPVALASNHLDTPLERRRAGGYQLGATRIPLDGSAPNSSLIGYWSPVPADRVSALDLLSPGFDPQIFKGKIVLIGQSSTAGKDLYPTPVFRFPQRGESRRLLSGIEIHAAAIATLLSGKTIRPMDAPWQGAINFLLVASVVASVAALRPVHSAPAFFGIVLGTYLLAQILLSEYQIWMKYVSTETAMILALPAGLGYRYAQERRLKARAMAEQRQLMGLFERYVSPEVAAEIWRRRGEIALTGEERTATIIFSDIRNFTAITAGRSSAEVLSWLNEYFTTMSGVVRSNRGFINKFIGDGLLLVFGVPLSEGVENDAIRAVGAALQMLEHVQELNANRPPERPFLQIGIGIHTGSLIAGNVGASDRLEYSVIGETVNLASRLEGLTKEFKVPIVMSASTAELVRKRYAITSLGEASVRGFGDRIRLYTVSNAEV